MAVSSTGCCATSDEDGRYGRAPSPGALLLPGVALGSIPLRLLTCYARRELLEVHNIQAARADFLRISYRAALWEFYDVCWEWPLKVFRLAYHSLSRATCRTLLDRMTETKTMLH